MAVYDDISPSLLFTASVACRRMSLQEKLITAAATKAGVAALTAATAAACVVAVPAAAVCVCLAS